MTKILKDEFPNFVSNMDNMGIENIASPLTNNEISELEKRLNIELPPSYKRFLSCMLFTYGLRCKQNTLFNRRN